jgi:hypothetical protein
MTYFNHDLFTITYQRIRDKDCDFACIDHSIVGVMMHTPNVGYNKWETASQQHIFPIEIYEQ